MADGWTCPKAKWKEIHRDVRILQRGDVFKTSRNVQCGVIILAIDPACVGPRYHEVDDCIRYIGSERDIDQRKRAAARIRHYNAIGHSFAEHYAMRLP